MGYWVWLQRKVTVWEAYDMNIDTWLEVGKRSPRLGTGIHTHLSVLVWYCFFRLLVYFRSNSEFEISTHDNLIQALSDELMWLCLQTM